MDQTADVTAGNALRSPSPALRATSPTDAGAVGSHPADEVLLADIHAAMAQDQVRGGAVEEHVRRHELHRVLQAGVRHVARGSLQRDDLVFRAVDLRRREALDVRDASLEARDQLAEA